MKPHYHVTENMSGYLPDSEPSYCLTKKAAEADALDRANAWRDVAADAGPEFAIKITGNKRHGYAIDRGEYTLPIYITIESCTETNCADEAEGW